MKDILTGNRILSCECYYVCMSFQYLFAPMVCDEKLALNCTFSPLHAMCCFSFVAFKILLLSSTFSSLTIVYLGVLFLLFILLVFGKFLGSLS